MLVTGGTGFIGSAIVIRLLEEGCRVRVLDDGSRGANRRIRFVRDDIELFSGDIRDSIAVAEAARGIDAVVHLAYINGTEHFYSRPEAALDVAVRGMINVLDSCHSHDIGELFLASSSEVYQSPPIIPTPEEVPLVVPDPLIPRYSYGGGKIICELMALNYGRSGFDRVVVFRPHNVYGPDMGWEHVLPQFVVRMDRMCRENPNGPIAFLIQGSGTETRAFNFIDDFVEGFSKIFSSGDPLGIYNIGSPEEVAISEVVSIVGDYFSRTIQVVPGPLAEGGCLRRCPDISKIAALGYQPKTSLREGLPTLADWYVENAALTPREKGATRQ